MKFINYLEGITGVSFYALTSLVIFVLFFTTVTIMVLREDKKSIDEQKNLPLN
ncbi:MAG: CcoQ/FixQ family Cbb3-type cytochrome c oxidase assembly chaperone [Flavobacteriales bacterium]|nr:CcoQ/FixQ family Cbb3-type cytochrome c oxidase assembly chaperone [Flavobacteriales bacterium]